MDGLRNISPKKQRAIMVVLCILMISISAYQILDRYGHEAHLIINVHFEEGTDTSDIRVYAYLDRWEYEDVRPGEKITISYDHKFSLFDKECLVNVFLFSYSSAGETTLRNEDVIMKNKGSYIVDLYI